MAWDIGGMTILAGMLNRMAAVRKYRLMTDAGSSLPSYSAHTTGRFIQQIEFQLYRSR